MQGQYHQYAVSVLAALTLSLLTHFRGRTPPLPHPRGGSAAAGSLSIAELREDGGRGVGPAGAGSIIEFVS